MVERNSIGTLIAVAVPFTTGFSTSLSTIALRDLVIQRERTEEGSTYIHSFCYYCGVLLEGRTVSKLDHSCVLPIAFSMAKVLRKFFQLFFIQSPNPYTKDVLCAACKQRGIFVRTQRVILSLLRHNTARNLNG